MLGAVSCLWPLLAAARGPRFPCPLDCTGTRVASCLGKHVAASGGVSGAAILLETHTYKNEACAFLWRGLLFMVRGRRQGKDLNLYGLIQGSIRTVEKACSEK